MLTPDLPLAIYCEGAFETSYAKMAVGILRYSPNPVACVIDSNHAGRWTQDLYPHGRQAPIVADVAKAESLGARVLVLGIAPSGGKIPESWFCALDEAVRRGLSIVNGLHDKLSSRYSDQLRDGQFVWDVRTEPSGIGVGTAAARLMQNRRILMIGTDMAVGKMTAGLELVLALKKRGERSSFVATGQTGMTIMGSGVPLDAVRLDYACGAVEQEVLKHPEADWVFVEGQGALIHPGSTASLPLVRGSVPTDFLLCHRAGMTHLPRAEWIQIPPLDAYVRLFQDLAEACGTYIRPRLLGVALDTRGQSDEQAAESIRLAEAQTGVVADDLIRFGPDRLADAILATKAHGAKPVAAT